MESILVQGTKTLLEGKPIEIGSEAPAVRVKQHDGALNVIGMIAPKVQMLILIPSLKTQTCAIGAQTFDQLLEGEQRVIPYIVTTDKYDDVVDHQFNNLNLVINEDGKMGKKYGVTISEGKLKGRLARSLFLVDKEGVVFYKQVVEEISDPIDYDACMQALNDYLSIKKKGHAHENWMQG
jgi:thiol peroxidase